MKNRIQLISIASGLLSIISLALLFVLGRFTDSLHLVSQILALASLISCLIAATIHKHRAHSLVYVFGLLSLMMHLTVARFTTSGMRSRDLEPIIINLSYIPLIVFMSLWILGAYRRSRWLESLGAKGILVSVTLSICLLSVHWLLWINE